MLKIKKIKSYRVMSYLLILFLKVKYSLYSLNKNIFFLPIIILNIFIKYNQRPYLTHIRYNLLLLYFVLLTFSCFYLALFIFTRFSLFYLDGNYFLMFKTILLFLDACLWIVLTLACRGFTTAPIASNTIPLF